MTAGAISPLSDTARGLAGCLFFVLAVMFVLFGIPSLLFQSFSIPAASMKPTLLIGDYVYVSKYAYGYTRYSFSFPLEFPGRIWPSEPKRGDLVVFRLPKDTSNNNIKRVIGLPGERIQMIDSVLYIEGQPVQRERIEDFADTDYGRRRPVKQWRETLPNGVSYATLDVLDNGSFDNTPVYNVPAGHYFMMGDNRDNAVDSRVLSQVGYVPFENLIGRVAIVFLSIAPRTDVARPGRIRTERIGISAR